ncbi:MAG: ABC transporter substrate-binding protein, partial [Paracoccus sp. (in: a-proteobacteria)]|nr:ABC transporter substrate-binding protein [Paracoccus sp. (in: a-proteobacteria)]
MKTLISIAAAAVLGLGTAAHAQNIAVSSKIDTEGGLLGNIILMALQDGGLQVTDRLQLGGTPIMRDAITSGQIDIYPEYTANGAFFFNEADSDVWKDADKGYTRVGELDLDQNNIVWLQPSPANNTWAIALRQDVADENSLVSMSDFGAWVAGGGDVKLAASTQF